MRCFRCNVDVSDVDVHHCALGGPIVYDNAKRKKAAVTDVLLRAKVLVTKDGQPFELEVVSADGTAHSVWPKLEDVVQQDKALRELVAKWRDAGERALQLDEFKFVSTVATGETLIGCAEQLESLLPRESGGGEK